MKFITENSIYIIEDDRYMRLPKNAVDRPDSESWRLIDREWHPLDRWAIENIDGYGDRLRLWTPDAVCGIITSLILEQESD